MYTPNTPISQVKGVGQSVLAKLKRRQINTVKDLLLFTPLRYLDARNLLAINQLRQLDQPTLVTIKAQVEKTSQFYRGSKTIQSAVVSDATGTLKLTFFNSPFVLSSLKKGQQYFFSGRWNPKYRNLTQPKFETVKNEQLHTGRLVPYYSSKLTLAQGSIRRLIKSVLDNLETINDEVTKLSDSKLLSIGQALKELHFPTQPENVLKARRRLALEEMLSIIDYSETAKKYLAQQVQAPAISLSSDGLEPLKQALPFKLTLDQERALTDILSDLAKPHPMNRLLMGDVGTGKTVVAGLACLVTVQAGHHAALVAPTTILTKQHAQKLTQLFPNLNIRLVTARSKPTTNPQEPTLFVGTHALINRLEQIKPALVVYDEQQKFGVWQRSGRVGDEFPHVLNMTATPIPRSLMLTLFSHVSLSILKTHPHKKNPTKTWVVDQTKRQKAFSWLKKQLSENSDRVVLVVAPFIDPSYHQALENVKAVTELFDEYRQNLPDIAVEMLHGRMTKSKQAQVVQRLTQHQVQVLVATPMIEVGIDLPTADIMIIESAERFGLANLHQLRGRVGRRGQESFCLLFTQAKEPKALERLKHFSQLNDGQKIAELDLKYRGSGDLFGTNQHGLSNLKFSSWFNPQLITQAKLIYPKLPKSWESFLTPEVKVGVEHLN